jgi:hypothetical protein
MYFNIKSIFLFGLVALSQASPITAPGSLDLEVRGGKKVHGAVCPDGTTLSKDDVGAAFAEAKRSEEKSVGYNGLVNWYPHTYNNREGFFGAKDLYEYPIIQGATFGMFPLL